MHNRFHQQFRPFHKEWYESLNRYNPTNYNFLNIAKSKIPSNGWKTSRNGFWFYSSLENIQLPKQGWKIHISATPLNCIEILEKSIDVCINLKVNFKFLIDKKMLYFMNGKIQNRGSAGKFMTIYPIDNKEFLRVIEALNSTLKGYEGPFILSDKRYKDSKVIYYRYGGINGYTVLNYRGEQDYVLEDPEGNLVSDIRHPYWNPPYWAIDPLNEETEDDDEDTDEFTLCNNRYIIKRPLSYSVTGGVYLAIDTNTNHEVVIKEARPSTEMDENGNDSIFRLKKEYKLLEKLKDTECVPNIIDIFYDWEHLFIVEEYIAGNDLAHFVIGNSPIMKLNSNPSFIRSFYKRLKSIWINVIKAIDKIHKNGIILGDLSLKNIILSETMLDNIKIIDLEGAWIQNIDKPPLINTPGFVSQSSPDIYGKENDIYSFGAIMLGTLFPMNNLLDLQESKKEGFISSLCKDLKLPRTVNNLIESCMHEDPNKRPDPQHIINVLEQLDLADVTVEMLSDISKDDLFKITNKITDYIYANADVHRQDRLFPSDPLVFYTNPLNISYGACGVIYALSKMQKNIPDTFKSWLLLQTVDSANYTPSLYLGTSGIAWSLLEIELEDYAEKIMEISYNHALLFKSPDIYYGASGVGLSCLKFYLKTKKELWLNRALEIGDWLINSRFTTEDGKCYWKDIEGNTWLGYAKGSSGIALYLLYLSVISGNNKYKKVGESALMFDLSYAKETNEGYYSIPRGTTDSPEKVLTHYWLDGSAGVCTTLLRYWHVTKDEKYLDIFNKMSLDTCRKYTIFPGLFRGLAGLGNLLLDAYDFIGDQKYLKEAFKVASGIGLFMINRNESIAFPGEQLFRISTDFGTGSSGIGMFLYRLAHADSHIGNFNFTLDEIFNIETNNKQTHSLNTEPIN